MALSLNSLPFEMLVHIVSFLPVYDLLQIASTSRVFQSAVNAVYSSRHFCQLESCVKSKAVDSEGLTFADVHHMLFNKYGFVIGTWKIVSTCYGGLVRVKFDGFKFVGTRYFPPPNHILRPLRPIKVFVIQISQAGNCECICYRGYNGPHLANIDMVQTNESEGFKLSCLHPEVHEHKEGEKAEFSIWLCDELGMEKNSHELHVLTPLHRRKFMALRQQESTLELHPLVIPLFRQHAVMQPGLFKGTYGDHGLELVLLTYDDTNNQAIITKVTGDPNIPADKVSVMVDLSRSIWLTEEQQFNIDNLDLTSPPEDAAIIQPFRLPAEIFPRIGDVPSTCIARYHSQGQIAAVGYTDPMFINGHWVIFDAHTFGHIWLLLHSFSMFSRVDTHTL